MKKIIIYGSLEFGKVIRDLAFQCGFEFAGFFDDMNSGEDVLGNFDEASEKYPPSQFVIAIAIGYNNLKARREVFTKVKRSGYYAPPLIHPQAYIRDKEMVGEGTFIMAGTVLDLNARLNELVVVWPGSIINHDSIVGANTFLSPNSTICGCVKIGENCFIGAGSTIVDHVEVPSNTFIKAGSLYTLKSNHK